MLLAAAGLVPRSPHRAAVLALAARRGSSRTDKKPPSLGLSVLGIDTACPHRGSGVDDDGLVGHVGESGNYG